MRRFASNVSGNFAVQSALFAPVLLGVAGFALDYSTFSAQQSKMRETADMAALAAVREAAVAGWNETTARNIAEQMIETNMENNTIGGAMYAAAVSIDRTKNRVTVEMSQDGHGYFLLGLGIGSPQIRVSSSAAIASSSNICVLALEPAAADTIKLDGGASLTGNRCGVFANSRDSGAIDVQKSQVKAEVICSAGGFSGSKLAYDPDPVTDCPAVPDPLADRQPPSVGSCDHNDTQIDGNATLTPGVYCGGIRITGSGIVSLKPGEYIIRNGPLELSGSATLQGDNVGFFFTGTTAKTSFGTATTINLTAPKTGPLAGILFFEDRNATVGREFDMSSKNARRLVGTIYLPKGTLKVTGASKFADASEWTAIIARDVEVTNGPSILLNSDYAASNIPVPTGISAETGRIFLTE